MEYYNGGESFNPKIFIDKKIEMEVYRIERYISFIDLICSDRLFNVYGDIVDENLTLKYIEDKVNFVKNQLKKIIGSYYNSNENKQVSIKKIDNLLGYVLSEMESFIKNKSSLIKNTQDAINFLTKSLMIWSKEEIGEISGVNKIANILRGLKTADINKIIEEKFTEYARLSPIPFSNVEEKYFKYLLKKTITNKYKVTKNDFSDFLIVSIADFNKPEIINDEISVITYDKRVKEFLQENSFYYDDEVYKLIYNNR